MRQLSFILDKGKTSLTRTPPVQTRPPLLEGLT